MRRHWIDGRAPIDLEDDDVEMAKMFLQDNPDHLVYLKQLRAEGMGCALAVAIVHCAKKELKENLR